MNTSDIPEAVAERMRKSKGSEDARRKLREFDIDGSWVDEKGRVHFRFRVERRIEALRDGATFVTVPVDGFTLDPDLDWTVVGWFRVNQDPN